MERSNILIEGSRGSVVPLYERWLSPPARGGPELMAAFQHVSEDLLESYPVSSLVNRAGVEDPRCLDPARATTLW